jgi:hypothetical protein
MANPLKGEAMLRLEDGREFRLVLDFEAFVVAEQMYGRPLPSLMADAGAGFVGAIRAMLYGALQQNHRLLTLADATAIFMADGDAVSEALERAGIDAFPKDTGDKEPGKDRVPLGTTSGASGAPPA